MQPQIGLLALLTLLATVSTPLPQTLSASFSTSQALAQTQDARKEQADRLQQQGLEQQTTNLQGAVQAFQQALTIYREIGDRRKEGECLNSLGIMYEFRENYKRAIGFYKQWLALAREIGDRRWEVIALKQVGHAYYNLNQNQRVIEFYQQLLATQRELAAHTQEDNTSLYYLVDPSAQADTLFYLGGAYLDLRQYQQALESFGQLLTISRELGKRDEEATALSWLGHVSFDQGEYRRAIEFYQQALTIDREIADARGVRDCLQNLGSAFLNSGNITLAETTLREAIQVGESIQAAGASNNDVFKVRVFTNQTDAYFLLQQALIAQNKTSDALEIAERGRARVFVELLASRLSDGSKTDSEPIASPTIKQIQQIAKQQKATLVEYSIASPKELYIWVIQPTGEVAFRRAALNPNTSLTTLVTSSRESIGVRGRGLTADSSEINPMQTNPLQQLYQLLIQPITDLLPKDPNQRVIFIPQKYLFFVPFGAIQAPTGKYLIEQHTILTAPAIQVLDLTHKQRQRVSGKDNLVVGNPTMPSIPPEFGQAPQPLPSLPGAEEEAKDIASLLNTKAITGNQATKAAILQRMSSAKIIHLATHGLLDDFKEYQQFRIPGAIALAPQGIDDGFLTASEILNLKLSAELIVLSACDTGKGEITGDGVLGLSRALILAGVPSAIVSLWSIPDAPTAFLMTQFYRQMQHNPDKAQALRQAMLATLKLYPNPRNWAAFTLIGEAE